MRFSAFNEACERLREVVVRVPVVRRAAVLRRDGERLDVEPRLVERRAVERLPDERVERRVVDARVDRLAPDDRLAPVDRVDRVDLLARDFPPERVERDDVEREDDLRFEGRDLLPRLSGMSTPARRASDNPIAMACFAFFAPCLPARMRSISSFTNSPACVLADFPARLSRCARSMVAFSGMCGFLQ